MQKEKGRKLRKKGKSGNYEIPIVNKKGEQRWWMISGAPVFDNHGNLKGTIGIHFDITDQKELEIANARS